jgi:ribosomal protein S27AE
MKFIIPEHRYGALSVPGSGLEERRAESRDRLARLAALDSEQLPMAMAFLSGYHPRVFDAILDAVEPCSEPGIGDSVAGQEPFCAKCGAPVGVFLAHGKEYRHYRGVLTATSKPRPYKADHAPVVAWRPIADAAVAAAR